MFGKRISCTVNPDVERDEAGYEPAAVAKNVLVVGAGPAGMEAAYIAAKRGHNVVLVDKQDEPGGEMRIAAVPPAKQELTRVIKYRYRRLAEAGVTCVFGTSFRPRTFSATTQVTRLSWLMAPSPSLRPSCRALSRL